MADGLEILLTSLAINMHINVVLEDSIWSTGREGINFSYPTIVYTMAGALPCRVFDPEEGNYADLDTTATTATTDSVLDESLIPPSLLQQKGGHLLTVFQQVSSSADSTSSDMDPDGELTMESVGECDRPHATGKASPQTCMVCHAGVQSKKALVFHLKQYHPEKRPYNCQTCLNSFNNNADLMCHMLNVHAQRKVHCKHCKHSTMTKAQMHQHVCLHTSGLKCGQCGCKFPNAHALGQHSELHKKHQEFICSTCQKIFATSNSLNIHIKGKHGHGYVCPCGKWFASPAQWSRHMHNCFP